MYVRQYAYSIQPAEAYFHVFSILSELKNTLKKCLHLIFPHKYLLYIFL